VKETGRTIHDWWIDHRWADLLVTALVVGGYGIVVWRTGRFDMLGWLTPSDRRGLYGAFAVVVSLTGAMSSVAVGQLASAKGPRATTLKKAGGPELAKSWRSIYVGAMGAALLALLALALDSTQSVPAAGHAAVIARWSFLVGLVLATTKFARLTALFQPVITASVKDDAESDDVDEAPALELNTS
jgi:uncharacterized membrane protein